MHATYSLCVHLQGAQAGSILGLDYMEASAAAGAAAAAAAGPELIPLLALRQRYNVPVTHPGTKHQKLRTVDAPFRLSGFVVHPRDAAQPSADPWTGNPTLTSVPLSANESPGGGRNPAGAAESDYGAARSAAQQTAQQTWQRSARTTRSKMSAKEGAKRQRSARKRASTTRSKMHGGKRGTNFKRQAKAAGRGKK